MIKIAIIGPNFFSYIESIRDEFDKRGIKSSFYDERHSNGILTKIIYRIKIDWIIKKRKCSHYKMIIDSIVSNDYTDVLLIGPEVINKEHVIAFKNKGIPVHLYMWDSARNRGKFLDYLNELNSKGSFDLNDCHAFNMKYIHLFAEDFFSAFSVKDNDRKIDISFCGTMHSDRSAHLYKMQKIASKIGLQNHMLLFFHSKFLFFIKAFMRPVNFYFFNKISSNTFSKKSVAASMFNSKFVLDLPHKRQSGLTMRTFEALRSGAYLITLNSNTNMLPKDIQNRIINLKKIDELELIDFSDKKRSYRIDGKQDYYLSVSRFVDNIIDMMGYDSKKYARKSESRVEMKT
ncbi:MAG: hypothetical protein ACTFAL_11185 [Candidatus Electronema sp. V4]|uniref:hypothetical protein n=1 Tax=Candidatus Electronema sp. V4 TaxID=3454756 RepID=UPI0040559428